MSLADIQADKDQLRAEFAIEVRKVEVALEKFKEKAIRELIEANKRRVEIQELQTELTTAKGQIQERDNANRVLQQTIKRRLPDLDSRLKAAKKALTELESINTELRNTVASQSEALKAARATLHSQRADIDRLRAALEAGGAASIRGLSKADARYLTENQRLSAELSRVQEQLARVQTSADENAMLRGEMMKLASQILSTTRGQEAHPGTPVMEVARGFTGFAEPRAPQEPEIVRHGTYGGNGGRHEPEMAETVMGTGMRQAEPAAPAVDAVARVEREEEASEPRGSLAERFSNRRKKRQASRESGKTLGERLKGFAP
jgi:hypothetical protein